MAPAARRGLFPGVAVIVALMASSCAKRTPPPPPAIPADRPETTAPRPERPPERQPERPAIRNLPVEESLGTATAARSEEIADPITTSPSRRDRGIEDGIEWWFNHWRTRGHDFFSRGLSRMGRYEDYVDAQLAARGMPPSLRYLPLIEANYAPRAVSRVGAGGMWQFMPETARWLGLEVNSLIDRRFDPYAATPLALEYLSALHDQFDSWFLALAAYNGGPGRVERLIQRHGGGHPRDDAMFMRIRDRLPRETQDFVPKFLAAVRVASDPEAYGIQRLQKESAERYEVVQVDGAASVDVLAAAADVTEEEIRTLNPHLRIGLTPAGKTTELRVPPGTGGRFQVRFAEIPPGDRVTLQEHRVVQGETLSHIARQYLISLDALRAANPGIDPRRMQIGTVLVIPRGAGQ